MTVVFFLVSFLAIFIKGVNNEFVIYENKKDFYRVILTIVFFGLGWYLFERTPSEDILSNRLASWFLLPFCIIATSILVIDNFILCVVNNDRKIFLGILIAVYRYFYMIIAFVIILLALHNGTNKQRAVSRFLLDMTIAASTAYVTYLLINGDAVQKKRRQLVTQ